MSVTTSNILAEQAQRILGGRTDDTDYDKRELLLSVKQGISYHVRQRYFLSKQDDVAEIPDILIKTYSGDSALDVIDDESMGDCYAVLPSTVMDLPHGQGITLVAPSGQPKGAFIPVPNTFGSMYYDLDSSCLQGRVGFYQDGKKIRFENMPQNKKPKKVMVRLVAPADTLADDDSIDIPADMQLEVLRGVLEIYGVYQKQDEINDQVDIK